MSVVSIANKLKRGNLLVGNAYYVPPAYESIATVTASGGETSLTFSSIPSTFKHLQIRAFMTHSSTSQSSIKVTVNGDTGANYSYHYLYSWSISNVGSYGEASMNDMNILTTIGGTNIGGAGILDIHDYASTSKYKTLRAFSGGDANGSGGVRLASGLWQSTSGITSVTIGNYGGTFQSGTVLALYGIKG